MSSPLQVSNVVSRSNVYYRQPLLSLHADKAYLRRIRGGDSIRLVANAITKVSQGREITAFVTQSNLFSVTQKQDYSRRFVLATGMALCGWDQDGDDRVVWKKLDLPGLQLPRVIAPSIGAGTAEDHGWFVDQDGRVRWGRLMKKRRSLLNVEARP